MRQNGKWRKLTVPLVLFLAVAVASLTFIGIMLHGVRAHVRSHLYNIARLFAEDYVKGLSDQRIFVENLELRGDFILGHDAAWSALIACGSKSIAYLPAAAPPMHSGNIAPETISLLSHLRPGLNVLADNVWNVVPYSAGTVVFSASPH
ncbi:MAG TPA: hypothetical protein ENN09_01010, partial [Planctomycetes bacterium]|nr:hypothetical protein [Planctomycetota bacterium]